MITCKICGKEFGSITPTHLRAKHRTTVANYRKKFPNAPLRSPEASLGTSQGLKGKPKSPKHLANLTEANRRKAKDPKWLTKVRANNAARRKPKPPRIPCLCGCGQLARSGSKWVSGHNGRGIDGYDPVRHNLKPRLCACGCGDMTKGGKFRVGHSTRARYDKPEIQLRKRKERQNAVLTNEQCICGCGECLTTGEVNAGRKFKQGHRQSWILRERKLIPCACGCGTMIWNLTNDGKKCFERGHWAKTDAGQQHIADIHQAPKPTKLEQTVGTMIKSLDLPFVYAGEGSIIVGWKYPDFVDLEHKLIIEVAGNYWHEPEYEQKRTEHFTKFGYKTLVLWEDDINKTPKRVKERIVEFWEGRG